MVLLMSRKVLAADSERQAVRKKGSGHLKLFRYVSCIWADETCWYSVSMGIMAHRLARKEADICGDVVLRRARADLVLRQPESRRPLARSHPSPQEKQISAAGALAPDRASLSGDDIFLQNS
eukprot:6186876-Pleurochrysis_carterae.AAC.1